MRGPILETYFFSYPLPNILDEQIKKLLDLSKASISQSHITFFDGGVRCAAK